MLHNLALQYIEFRGDCDDRRRRRYLDEEEGHFQMYFSLFGPRIASKGWHNRILYKCASMIDSPRTVFFSRPPDAWKHKVQELRVALQAISVHECHDICLLLELEITPGLDTYRERVRLSLRAQARIAKFPCSNIVYDDSSDEDTVTTTMTTTTIASFWHGVTLSWNRKRSSSCLH